MSMLTTVDNPYDPYTNYDDWCAYDEEAGYCTNGYVARIASTSPAMTEAEEKEAIEDAIDEIVRLDPLGIYVKLTKPGLIGAKK